MKKCHFNRGQLVKTPVIYQPFYQLKPLCHNGFTSFTSKITHTHIYRMCVQRKTRKIVQRALARKGVSEITGKTGKILINQGFALVKSLVNYW